MALDVQWNLHGWAVQSQTWDWLPGAVSVLGLCSLASLQSHTWFATPAALVIVPLHAHQAKALHVLLMCVWKVVGFGVSWKGTYR